MLGAHRVFVVGLLMLLLATPIAWCAEVLDASFVPDQPFPQFARLWSGSVGDETDVAAPNQAGRPLGGYAHVYVRNNGAQPVSINDVLLEGISLKRAIAYSDQRKFKHVAKAASIYFSDLPKADRDKLIAAGEPVWWKVDPASIDPGETGEVTIRLRRMPVGAKDSDLRVSLILKSLSPESLAPTNVSVRVGNPPVVRSVGFGPGMKEVYLYLKSPSPGRSLKRVLIDGRDVTSLCEIGRDSRLDLSPVVCKLSAPFVRASYHCFQGVYEDGSKATAGLRCWDDELFYGMWGARPGKENEIEKGRAFVKELAAHNMNGHMISIASDAVRVFMISQEGRKLLESLGIRRVIEESGKADKPAALYLADEPDTADYKVTGVPEGSKIGSIAQGLLEHSYALRKIEPDTPNMTNINMTFKPDCWYTYGQLPDILATDPYFQSHLAYVYQSRPYQLPQFTKATEVYATAACCESACAPKPLHVILNCVQTVRENFRFRFGTPEEKRIEVYYALGAGAKAMSYWWFVPLGSRGTGANGLGADTPEARALWKEIGLLGAEARTAGPILTRACVAELPVEAPGRLWVRSLVAGLDTIVLFCVNDDYACDRVGTVVRPVEKAKVGISLPSWLDPKSVFEITCGGTRDVASQAAGSRLSVELGTVNVSRLVVITSDPGLRDRLQNLYRTRFAANVALLEQ